MKEIKKLTKYIIKEIVSNPRDVKITVEETEEPRDDLDNGTITVFMKVNEEDKGLVIGREGRTINSIRTILAIKARKKVILKVE